MKPMKKHLIWFSIATLPLWWTACDQNTMVRDLDYTDEFEEVYPPEPVPKLLTFANGENIQIQSNGGQIVAKADTLKWVSSPLHEGSAMMVRYQVLLGTEDETFKGDESTILSVFTSGEEGKSTALGISHILLNDIAANAGISPGETGTLTWKVRAYCGLDKTLSNVTGNFTVTRPQE